MPTCGKRAKFNRATLNTFLKRHIQAKPCQMGVGHVFL